MQFDIKVPSLYPKRKRKVSTKTRKELMYKPKKCAYCRKNESMHLHHIRGFAKGGSDRKTNLVPLCANCHYKIHHRIITTEQLRRRLGIKIKPKSKKSTKRKPKNITSEYEKNWEKARKLFGMNTR
jgi:hypothetical protein